MCLISFVILENDFNKLEISLVKITEIMGNEAELTIREEM